VYTRCAHWNNWLGVVGAHGLAQMICVKSLVNENRLRLKNIAAFWQSRVMTPYLSPSCRGIALTARAPKTMNAATANNPALALPVCTFSQPTIQGETKPARLPTLLMKAIPTAADVPAKNAVGTP
jgi:hypothetical protein